MVLKNQRQDLPDPKQGDSFRRTIRHEAIETVKIISVAADHLGIPHVRFSLKIASPRMMAEETRTLSLESFRLRYHEQVPARG